MGDGKKKIELTATSEPATIMVIDDEERIRKILSLQLEKAGYNVIALGSGSDALELLGQVEVDLVITDIRMPDITGDKILKYIKFSKMDKSYLKIKDSSFINNIYT